MPDLQALQNIFPTVTGYISSSSVVQLIRNPYVYSNPVNTVNTTRTSFIAGVMGAMGMAAIICWLLIKKETIQTRSGARNLLDSPIIAAVCKEGSHGALKDLFKKDIKTLQVFSPTISFNYAEQINTICSKLEQ